MAFHFSLETFLRYRRSVERQRELKLLHAVQEVVSVTQEIAIVDGSISATLESQSHAVTGAQLHFDGLRCSVLRERRLQLERTLVQRQKFRALCEREFHAAHRDREAVEILREEQLQSYRLEEDRREQRRLDDIFLLRREYLLRR
jgi:flagellar export protein FliJ